MPENLGCKREFYTRERCFVSECWNTPDDPHVSIARIRVEPGVRTERHYLTGVDERYVVLHGKGVVEVGASQPRAVSAGDVVFICAGDTQCISNTGDEPLIFYCVCTPRFVASCYVPLEDD